MDSITHLASGVVLGFARPFLPKRTSLALSLPLGLLITSLPDLDVLFGRGLMGTMTVHRGLSHSLIMILILSVFTALIAYYCSPKLRPRPKRLELFGFAMLGLSIHVMFDCLTAFGTQIFLPWSNHRFSLPILYIIDLSLTLPLLFASFYGFLTLLKNRGVFVAILTVFAGLASIAFFLTPKPLEPLHLIFPLPVLVFWVLFLPFAAALPLRLNSEADPRRIALLALLWIFLYPAFSYGVSTLAESKILAKIEAKFTAENNGAKPLFGRSVIFAEPFSPLNWKLLCEDNNKIYMAGFSFLEPNAELQIEGLERPSPELWSNLAASSPLMNAYTRFIEYPALQDTSPMQIRAGDAYASKTVAVLDLRYKTSLPKVFAAFGRKTSMFSLEFKVDEQNKILGYRSFRGRYDENAVWVNINE